MHQVFGHQNMTLRFERHEPVHIDVRELDTGPGHLARVEMSCDLNLGTSALGLYYTGIAHQGMLSLHQHGQEAIAAPCHDSPYLLRPHAHTTIHHAPGTTFCVLGIDPAALESTLAGLLEHPVKPLRTDNTANAGAGRGLVPEHLMTLLEAELTGPTGLLHPGPVADRLWDAIVTALLYGARHQYSEELHAPTARLSPRTLTRAITAMEADPAHPFTIAELAAIAGVGPRALQNAFREHRGTTPLAYLRHLRLKAAHAELLNTEPPATVTEVATHWGFTHPGRFATLYKQHYAQTPSQTLRQRPNNLTQH